MLPTAGLLMNLVLRMGQSFLDGGDGGQHLILDFDEAHRLLGRLFVNRADRGHRLADVAHPVDREGGFVLGRGHDAVFCRQIGAGDDVQHSGK